MRIDGARFTRWARWVATFVGFPLAGVAARLVVGDVDAAGSAAIGGLVGGAVLGTVQAVVGGIDRADRLRWAAATAAAMGAGLAAGGSLVGFRTDTAALVVMGAVSGAAVGLGQALAVPMRRIDRFLWAAATPVLWAGGWFVTSQVIVDADRHHAVFGSSGALAVSAAAGVLYAMRHRTGPGVVEAGTGTTADDRVAA